MTTINPQAMDTLSQATGLTAEQSALGQEQFLKLMMTQLQNQDPTAPMESADFLGQLAQFGTVSGIQGLQQQFMDVAETLSSDRALRGAALLGKTALTPTEQLRLPEDGDVRFSLDLPSPASRSRSPWRMNRGGPFAILSSELRTRGCSTSAGRA